MTSLLTTNYYVGITNNFISDVCNTATSYYVFVARPNPWTNANGTIDETAVQAVNNSVTQIELDLFNELLYGKRISNSSISQSIRRVDWTANTVYDEYDANDEALYDKDFFVVTTGAGDEYNVYKCIYNNNGANSTVKPAMKSTSGTFTTGDGYIWKYIYTVDAGANTKFTTSGFIPLSENANVQGNAVPGTIDAIKIVDGGSGYQVYQTGELQAVVDNYTLKIAANSSTSNDYYSGSSIYLKSGFGAGQVRAISDYDGSSKNIVVTEPIDIYLKLELSNTANIVSGGANVGQLASQTYDTIELAYKTGYFNPGSNIIQSDTNVLGRILNTGLTNLIVSRYNKTTEFNASYPFRSTADTGTVTTDLVTVTTTGALSNNAKVVVNPGSGYSANTTTTITANGTGSGAVANAIADSTGRISDVYVTTTGSNYTLEPIVTVTAPVAQTFNSNNIVSNAIPLATASKFLANDLVTYTRSTGNSNIGVANGTYYVSYANNTHIALSTSSGGSNIALTNTATTETGHTVQGQTATVRLYPDTLFVKNAASGAVFASEYAVNNYIRVGSNANSNIRRVTSVNSTIITVNLPFVNSFTSNAAYRLNTAAEPNGNVTVYTANAYITNSNLSSIKLTIANVSPTGESFIVGEKVDYVDSSNLSLSANGIVAYTNSTVVYLSNVLGTWNANNRIKGVSSDVIADVITYDTKPNILIKNASNTFSIGYPVDFTETSTAKGSAVLTDITSLSAGIIEYEIGPRVTIQGDGSNAIAVAQVDISNNSGNTINKIVMVNPGSYYTQANITITSNTSYGSNASVTPVISPLLGHGADPAYELGARYAAIDVSFANSQTEEWEFPTGLSFRKIGIIKDPVFANATITVANFDRVELTLANTSGSWTNGEVVLQDMSTNNATGIVVSGNSTYLQLKQVKGTFTTSNNVLGLTSNSSANVTAASVLTFSSNTVITQTNTGATATVLSTSSNTTLYISNVHGQFASNQEIYSGNTYATVTNITTVDGSNATSNFGTRFNQTSRITLNSNVGSFTSYEYVTQGSAIGRVVSTTMDLDLVVANGSNISISDVITNANTGANAHVIFANSTYLKLTGVTNALAFATGQTINTASTNTTISNVHAVLVLSDVTKNINFSVNSTSIIGNTANGSVKLVTYPDLMRESGKVIYTEASNTVVNTSINSTEEVRLIIKF